MDTEENGKINIKEFISTRQVLIRDDYFDRNKNIKEFIKNDMQLPETAVDRLEEICNPQLLNPSDEQKKINNLDDFDTENLSLLDFVKKNFNRSQKRVLPFEIKFRKNLAKLIEQEPLENDRIETPDVVLSVQISQGLNSKIKKLAWSEDYLVLGQNYLTDLKDKITCFRNEIKLGEFSQDPDQIKNAPLLKDAIPSGYFLIENFLYNDFRISNNDSSVEVIKWAKEKKLGDFHTLPMESTKFADLNIRLGFPYLFRHLGDCEHLVVFTSIKLVNPSSDSFSKSKYPIPKDKTRGRFTFCWCCNRLYAKWVICNSKFAVDDPTFLCERCFMNTHYEYTDQIKNELEDQEKQNESEEKNEPLTSASASLETTKQNTKKLRKLFDFKAYHFSQLY